MRHYLIISLVLLVTSCSSPKKNEQLVIATTASSQFAFKEIAEEFTKQHQLEVDIITGSSGKLTTQILNGAPYDIFISANMEYPKILEQANKVHGTPTAYGIGIPVFWTMDSSIKTNSISQFLSDPKVKRIAVANSNNAPYGESAIRFLKATKHYKPIQHKFVFGESISQVNEYIFNKTVDAGFTAKSVVMSPKLKNTGYYIELDEEFHIAQGITLIKNDTPDDYKVKFKDFVLSSKGKSILSSYGYSVKND